MRIGITDCHTEDKYNQYVAWIRSADQDVDLVKLSHTNHQHGGVKTLDGLLLTGGGDVDPALYGSPEMIAQTHGVDRNRDEFELNVIEDTLRLDLPLLGVCRGMQVMNVALGGSLHVDLSSEGFDNHAGSQEKLVSHAIAIEPNSLLSGLAGGLEQEVNSFHHQAVNDLGRGLMPVAKSRDGVVEAAEWLLKEGMPFLLLVQWHPERVNSNKNEFSTNLAKIFLREVQYSIANKTPYIVP